MGQQIVYCAKCGLKLKETAFRDRQAFSLGNRKWCVECIKALMPSLSESRRAQVEKMLKGETTEASVEVQETPHPKKMGTSRVIRKGALRRGLTESGQHRASGKPPERKSSSALPLVIIGVVLVGVAGVAAFLAFGGGKRSGAAQPAKRSVRTRPRPVQPQPVAAPVVPDKPDKPKLEDYVPPSRRGERDTGDLQSRLEAARAYAKENPDQVPEIVERYRDMLMDVQEGSELFEVIQKELKPHEEKLLAEIDREIATVRADVELLLADAAYQRALDMVEAERARRSDPEWTNAVFKIKREIEDRIEAEWLRLAGKAQSSGSIEEAQEILRPVHAWGFEEYGRAASNLLERLRVEGFRPVRPPEPPEARPGPEAPPEEAPPEESPPEPAPGVADETEVYAGVWKKVSNLALAGDFEGALQALDAQPLTQDEFIGRVKEDRKALQYALQIREMILSELDARIGVGDLTLQYYDPAGSRKRARGMLLRVSGSRVELTGSKESQFVELAEILPESYWVLVRTRGRKVDRFGQMMAYYLLFSGDPKSAEKAVGDYAGSIPKRYWAHCRTLAAGLDSKRKSRDRQTSKREREVRGLFYAAERRYRSMTDVAMAIVDFKMVLSRYGDTDFVQRNRAELEARAGGGQEWLISAPDIKKKGKLWVQEAVRGAPTRVVWRAPRDSTPDDRRAAWLETAFHTKSGTNYRVWLYLYACCRQTTTFGVQGTGVKGQSASGEVGCEPGTGNVINSPGPRSLPESHSHGLDQYKWRWVRLTTVFPGQGGISRVRIMTENGDIALAYVYATSTGARPPSDPDATRSLVRRLR